MSLSTVDLEGLVAEATTILDEASKQFVSGHRAESAVQKKGNDFATEVDLSIERHVVAALQAATGIGVHGEEFGGPDLNSPLVWVLDPIDGTFNYAAGSPMAAILLGLLRDGEPVAGLTWVPFADQRYTAVQWGPCAAMAWHSRRFSLRMYPRASSGWGTFNVDARGRFPGRYRLAILEDRSRVSSKLRMHGATGIDIAYVAAGIMGAASVSAITWGPRGGVVWCVPPAVSSPICPAKTGPSDRFRPWRRHRGVRTSSGGF